MFQVKQDIILDVFLKQFLKILIKKSPCSLKDELRINHLFIRRSAVYNSVSTLSVREVKI